MEAKARREPDTDSGRSARERAGVVALAGAFLALVLGPAISSAGYVNYPDFKRTGGLVLNGSADVTESGALRITDGSGQAGSVFTQPKAIDTAASLKTSFRFSQHDGSGNAGDGFTFAIQSDERGAQALGSEGGSMGYGGPDGITDSVAVEFDLYEDSGTPPLGVDHVAIVRDGDETDHLAPVAADIYGGDRYVWIDYSSKKKSLSVYLATTSTKPADPITSAKVNLPKTVGSSTAHAGFTGGTGAEYVTQDIFSWKVTN
jgi:hypothetical protein